MVCRQRKILSVSLLHEVNGSLSPQEGIGEPRVQRTECEGGCVQQPGGKCSECESFWLACLFLTPTCAESKVVRLRVDLLYCQTAPHLVGASWLSSELQI